MKLQSETFNDGVNVLSRGGEAIGTTGSLRKRFADSVVAIKRRLTRAKATTNDDPALNIARYNLVLMDADGQVVWGKEFDAGGVFRLRPGHRLWVSCEFTNHSSRQAEVAVFEIELTGEDGAVVSRFGDSYGDVVVVEPGASRQFVGEWSL